MSQLSEENKISKDKLSQRDLRTIVFYLTYGMEAFDYDIDLNLLAEKIFNELDIKIELDPNILKKAQSIVDHKEEIDKEIAPLLANWSMARLGCITKLILRLAIWELKNTDLPPSIVINEAIELAKSFGETDSYKFVNGILDKWLKEHQPDRVPKEE